MRFIRATHALTTALLLTACSSAAGDDDRATGAKGAVQINPREDIYLLSFITRDKQAEDIAKDLRSEKPVRARKQDVVPEDELFGHLGLAEPQTLPGTRWAGVCPPCVGDHRRKRVQWIETYLQPLKEGDRTRVYLYAF
ncbi:hypothetical protein ACFV0R_08645 [Streptomyces sp. NPDC059578]|uniref:hypothetical protein n=1 Tax=unclassified Streptomyces TaxID=2593676 RepID=UPI003654F891